MLDALTVNSFSVDVLSNQVLDLLDKALRVKDVFSVKFSFVVKDEQGKLFLLSDLAQPLSRIENLDLARPCPVRNLLLLLLFVALAQHKASKCLILSSLAIVNMVFEVVLEQKARIEQSLNFWINGQDLTIFVHESPVLVLEEIELLKGLEVHQ